MLSEVELCNVQPVGVQASVLGAGEVQDGGVSAGGLQGGVDLAAGV